MAAITHSDREMSERSPTTKAAVIAMMVMYVVAAVCSVSSDGRAGVGLTDKVVEVMEGVGVGA